MRDMPVNFENQDQDAQNNLKRKRWDSCRHLAHRELIEGETRPRHKKLSRPGKKLSRRKSVR